MGFDGWPLTALQIGVTVVVAMGSYFILEQPIRRRGLPTQTPARFIVAGVLASPCWSSSCRPPPAWAAPCEPKWTEAVE